MGGYFILSRLLIFAFLQAAVFLLILFSTPLDVFRAWGIGGCYGFFGLKHCGAFGGTIISTSWGCSRRESTMDAAAAFAIISILSSCTATVMALLMYFRTCFLRLSLFIVSLLTGITLLITWACVADVYHKPMCGSGTGFGALYNYGPAFGLIVFTWILQVFAVILCGIITF
ncbi:amastin-like surface protein-like protein [Trypanosoma theileri]|uniref:Amastin-like surface protein-like protein n=1 Tax=Trypanosoma theileri TaxID=67003 RepID=A0A1X0NX81_9TRYP|nr:amastin-like surface protein-like protein [Trypanosoma theileri]ORC88730.1 amastin-like surface protein-like protein [Trypanosoma theileri]